MNEWQSYTTHVAIERHWKLRFVFIQAMIQAQRRILRYLGMTGQPSLYWQMKLKRKKAKK